MATKQDRTPFRVWRPLALNGLGVAMALCLGLATSVEAQPTAFPTESAVETLIRVAITPEITYPIPAIITAN